MPNSVWRESLSRSILDLVEDKANIGSWSWNLESGEVNWSVGVYRIFSISPDELPALTLIADLADGNDAPSLRSTNPLVAARFLADRKFTIRRRDGEMRTIHSHGKLLLPGQNSNAQFVGAFLDITDSRVEDELFLLREALLDSMRQLFGVDIWQTDPHGALSDPMRWRIAVEKSSNSDGSWGGLEQVHPEDHDAIRRAWSEAFSNKKTYSSSFRMRRGESYVPAQSKAVSLLDSAGELLGWIGFTRQLDATNTNQSGAISAAQIRAARALLNWTGRELAAKAGISFSSVRRAEADDVTNISDATLAAIRQAFQDENVIFTASATGAIGVSFSE